MSAPPAPRRASSRPDSFPVPARAPGTPLLPSATARAAVWRLALSGLLAVSALPGVAGLAHADALVGNLGQTTHPTAEYVTVGVSQAQRYDTGSSAAGYDLTSVEVDVASIPDTPANVAASIYSLARSGSPRVEVFRLANPATFSVGANVFTAPSGATLSADTGYFVVVAYGGTDTTDFTLNLTSSDDEDSGGATGWTIDDVRRLVAARIGSRVIWTPGSHSLKIRVNGSAIPVPDTTAPMLQSATTTALELALTYDEALDAGSEPGRSAFTVAVNGHSWRVTGVALDGAKVLLTLASVVPLASVVRAGDFVRVSYTAPVTNQLRDEARNPAVSFANHPVTNESSARVPDAPTSLEATPGDRSVTLRWTAPANDGGFAVTGYQYRRKTPGSFLGVWRNIIPQSAPPDGADATRYTVTVTGLTNGTAYTFEVQALSVAGESGPSNEATATPEAPPMLMSATTTALELALIYDENLDAGSEPAPSAFTVTVNGASRGVTGVALDGAKVLLTLASAVQAGDTVTVSYTVPVTNLLRGEGNNPVAPPFADHPVTNEVPATVPDAPTNLVAGLLKEGVGESIYVALAWTRPVSDGGSEITYQYRWKTTGDFGDWQNSEAAVPVRGNIIGSLVDLPINARYTFEVRARNVAGYSDESNQSSVTVVDSRLVTTRNPLVEGDRLEATYSEALDAGFEPAPSAFTVTVNGASRAVTGVSLDGAKLILTLASPVQPDDVVRFAYAIPDTNALRGESGNFIAGFGLVDFPVRHPYTRPAHGQVVQSDRLEVTFYKALDAGFEPAPSAFTVTAKRVSRAVTGVSLDGAKVILTLASPVQPDDAVRLTYTVPDANALRGESGNFIAGFEDFPVLNPLSSSSGPEDRSRVVQGDRLEVTFSEALDAGFEPAPSAFEVSFDNIPQEVTGVSLDGAKLILTLASPVQPGDAVQLGYAIPDTNALRGESGSTVAGFDKHLVTNLSSSTIVLTLAPASVHEGDGATEVTVTASLDAAPRTEATEVTVSVAGDTATEGTDFTAVDDFTVTIPAMQTSTTTTFTFSPIQDEIDEPDETVVVTGTASASGLPVARPSATVTVVDDDAAPEITIAAAQPQQGGVTEGSGATADFVVGLSAPSGKDVSVTYSTRGGTATALDDFIGQSDVLLTFAPGEVEKTISILLVDDDLYEARPEQFTVQLFLPRNASVAEGNTFAVGTIVDDDPEPTLSIAADAGGRGDEGPITFTVTLSEASGGPVAVFYATEDGTATGGVESEGADYESVPRGLLVFRPGDTQQTLTVDVFDDDLAEGEETFTVRLSQPLRAALDMDLDSAVGTIMDDDALTASVSASPEVTEGNAATFRVRVTGATSTAAVVVSYTVSGTAEAGSDYTAPSGTLTIGAGDPDGAIMIETLVDMVMDGGETLVVTLTDARTDKGVVTAAATPAETQILDEGTTAVSVAAGDPVTEGGDATFTVTLSGAVPAPVMVNWSTSDGTATVDDSDYAAGSGTVTFPTGTTTPQTVTVATVDDALVESDETFTVTLTALGFPAGVSLGMDPAAMGTIEDNDTAAVSVVAGAPVTEGGEATFTVMLSGAVSAPVMVNWSTSDGTATGGSDYVAGSGTVTFPTGTTTPQTLTFTTVNDTLAEADETFTVALTALGFPAGVSLGMDPAAAVGTIVDDDPEPTLSIADAGVREDEGPITFTVTLSGASGSPVTVDYAMEDGTATGGVESDGADYESVPSGRSVYRQLVFPPGDTQQTFTVDVFDDEFAEGEETFTVRLLRVSGDVFDDELDDELGDGEVRRIDGELGMDMEDMDLDSAVGTIMDDDALTVSVSASPEVTEGNDATFRVRVTGATSTAAVVVSYTVSGTAEAGSDYTAPSGTLTIGAGDPDGTIMIETLVDMVVDGGETLVVTLTGARTDKGVVTAAATPAETQILDTPSMLSLTLDPAEVAEGAGATEVTVTASLDAVSRTAATEVTVSVAGDTATEGTDFTAVDGFTVTIPAMETSATSTFTFIPIQDDTVEGAETLTVSGSATGLTGSTATLTLADDDTASTGVALTLDPAEVAEGAGETEVTVTASLDAGARTAATEVTVSVAGDTATEGTDFTAVDGFTVTIPAMETSATSTFTFIPIQDDSVEGAETLTVSGSATGLTGSTATLTLADDDTASTGVALTLDPAEVAEGAGETEVTVTASLDAGARTAATEVTVSVAGDTATEGTDFTAVDGFTVTIPAMETSATSTFTFIPLQDDTVEGAETVTVSGSATGLTGSTATLTLADDDTASTGVALTLDPAEVAEGAGETEVTVTASLDAGARTAATEVTVSVAGHIAIAGTDFTAVDDFTVTIPAMQTSATTTFTFFPLQDETAEGAEVLTVSGSATGLAVDDGTLTIIDDDTASTGVALTLDPAEVAEGAGETEVTVTASLDAGARTAATGVTVSVAGNTATEGTDFTAVDDFTVTIPAMETSATSTFTFIPIQDETVEGAETLTVSGSATGLTVDTATLILADDDTASTGVALTLDPAEVAEGAGATEVTVTASLDAGARTEATEVTVTVAGNATEGTDFTAVDGFTVTISAGQTSATSTFTFIPQDETAEGAETLTVSGSATGLTVARLHGDDFGGPDERDQHLHVHPDPGRNRRRRRDADGERQRHRPHGQHRNAHPRRRRHRLDGGCADAGSCQRARG